MNKNLRIAIMFPHFSSLIFFYSTGLSYEKMTVIILRYRSCSFSLHRILLRIFHIMHNRLSGIMLNLIQCITVVEFLRGLKRIFLSCSWWFPPLCIILQVSLPFEPTFYYTATDYVLAVDGDFSTVCS